MKIAIISDTHDNIVNLDKALQYIRGEKIKTIIHLGDVVSQETLDYLAENFSGKLFIARGNADLYDIKNQKLKITHSTTSGQENKYANIKIFEEYGEIEIDKRKIGFVHKKSDIPNFQTPYTKYHIPNTIFYGHSHKPWIEEIKGVTYANPGNLAGIHYDPTFAVYETSSKKIKLIILNQI